jgi:surface antigen
MASKHQAVKASKNRAAVALGKLSAASKTPLERKELAALGGSIGGKARAKSLSAAQRKKIAKAAAKARWAGKTEK